MDTSREHTEVIIIAGSNLDRERCLPEAVRQLRGTSTSQVDGAEVALVTGAITDPAGAVLLGRG